MCAPRPRPSAPDSLFDVADADDDPSLEWLDRVMFTDDDAGANATLDLVALCQD